LVAVELEDLVTEVAEVLEEWLYLLLEVSQLELIQLQ
jgi:hypothetical protein